MKQIIQDIKGGETILADVPAPTVQEGQVLIQTTRSLVSLGTERMLVEFGKANFIQKARQQPDKVKMVLGKMKTDGIKPTIEAVFNKLSSPLPLGYSNVGKVIGVGKGVTEFAIGDRVVSNGNHAEVVSVPKNLVAHIPDNVSDEEAAFTVIGAIALQGQRLINPTFGETIVVIGLGLIGLVSIQLLKANGINVIGFDFDKDKVELAKSFGIDAVDISGGVDAVKYIMSATNQVGADGVLITASTKSNQVISDAANMSRKRGRIVLVGVIGLNISRADFYEKELTFQVSCSYGPGRYDDVYEQKGQDYPLPYVRWTEKRNFEAVLNAISQKWIDVKPLITEVLPLAEYNKIYGNMKNSKSIASILKYDENIDLKNYVTVNNNDFSKSKGVIGIIGAGNFTQMQMLPALSKTNADIKYIVSSKGVSSTNLAKKYNIANSSTNYKDLLNDAEVDLVMVMTRHDSHAKMVIEALENKKHVFVEKPLALNQEDLDKIKEVYEKSGKTLTVGFNRRFSPFSVKMKQIIGSGDEPINVIATMNAGAIPKDVWVHDMEIGGGRIVGEACHFIDLISYLTGSKVTEVVMNAMGVNPQEDTDTASILLKYENGSTGVINYFANGSKLYSKERIEVYSQERTLILDNFRELKGYGTRGFSKMKSTQDKGHNAQFKLLVEHLKEGKDVLIPFDSLYNTTKASFAALESLRTHSWVKV